MSFPNIEFGAGTIRNPPDAVSAFGMARPLLISDRGWVVTGMID